VTRPDTSTLPAPATEATGPPTGRFGGPVPWWEFAWLAIVIGVFAAVAIGGIGLGAPLGHDEAVYSLQARTYAAGVPSVGFWDDYRAPGLPWMLQVAWLGPATEPYLRLVVAALGAVGLVFTWLIGRYLFGRAEGLVAAVGVGLSPIWVAAATHVWPDVPGAVIGLAVLAVLVFASHDGSVSWWVLLAAPLTFLATVVRYGAPGPILVGALAIAWWRRETIRNALAKVGTLAVLTGAPLALLLLTNAVFSTDTPPLRAAAALRPNRGGALADGWVVLWQQLPSLLAQPAVLLMFIGLAIAATVPLSDWDMRRRRSMVLATSLGTLLVLATALSSELRYFAPLLPWMWLGAALGLVHMSRLLERRSLVALVMVAVVALGFSIVDATTDEADVLSARFQRLREATRDREWAVGCHVATSYGPQVGWYSECTTTDFVLGSDLPLRPSDAPTDVLVVLGGKRQPESLYPWLQNNAVLEFTYGDRRLGDLQLIEVYAPIR
jgi:hypothetical protein